MKTIVFLYTVGTLAALASCAPSYNLPPIGRPPPFVRLARSVDEKQSNQLPVVDQQNNEEEEVFIYIPDHEEATFLRTIPELPDRIEKSLENNGGRHKRSTESEPEEVLFYIPEEVLIYIPDEEEADILSAIPQLPENTDESVTNTERHKRSTDSEAEEVLIYIPDNEEVDLLRDVPELPDNFAETSANNFNNKEAGLRQKRSPQRYQNLLYRPQYQKPQYHDLLYRYPQRNPPRIMYA